MHRIIAYAVLAVSVPLVGCAGSAAGAGGSAEAGTMTELTRIGEAVEVTDNTISVQECEFITDVPFDGGTDENAVRALRNTAGRLGANTILLVMSGTTVTRVEGYLCGD